MKKVFFMMLAMLIAITSIAGQGGHYKGGRGSSHKGGKYKNAATNDHYRKRKH